MGVIIIWSYRHKNKVLATLEDGLELVSVTVITLAMIIPVWFSKRVLLWDKNKRQYHEFIDSRIESALKKIKKGSEKDYLNIIKEYQKKREIEFKNIEKNRKRAEKKDNEDFMKFVKYVGIIVGILIIYLIIKAIFLRD